MQIYTKTDPDMPRPTDLEYYMVTRDGTFFCRNHPLFQSDIPCESQYVEHYTPNTWSKKVRVPYPPYPQILAPHAPRIVTKYPKVPHDILCQILGFFEDVETQHHSEAIALLYWDVPTRKYIAIIPRQKVSSYDLKYDAPIPPPENCLLLGDIHSHGTFGTQYSQMDADDETHFDGMHAIVGGLGGIKPYELSLSFICDGWRIGLDTDKWLPSDAIPDIYPEEWMTSVTKVSYVTNYLSPVSKWLWDKDTHSWQSPKNKDQDDVIIPEEYYGY